MLGLIFLRHATTRFHALLPEVERNIPARATGALREERIRLGFQGKAAIYLPETARYDHLAALPAGAHVGEAIRDAMIAIEDSVTDQNGSKLLAGALPKDYLGLERDLLAELVKIFNSPLLASARGDVFGRIYEYFLNQFAARRQRTTPPSLVRMIVSKCHRAGPRRGPRPGLWFGDALPWLLHRRRAPAVPTTSISPSTARKRPMLTASWRG